MNGGADDGRQFLVDGATSTASGMTALPMAYRLRVAPGDRRGVDDAWARYEVDGDGARATGSGPLAEIHSRA